jgi:hypothetical protein
MLLVLFYGFSQVSQPGGVTPELSSLHIFGGVQRTPLILQVTGVPPVGGAAEQE